MRTAANARSSAFRLYGRISCILLTAYCLLACSIPNLEEPDCTAARDVAREFYSYHLAHDMRPSEENLRLREKFLTAEYANSLRRTVQGMPATTKDYFTDSEDFPKAFRVAECTVLDPGKKVQFNILLFWKDDVSTVQKRVVASVNKDKDSWLIDLVSPIR